MDIYIAGPNNKWWNHDGVYEKDAHVPSLEFRQEVMEFVSDIEFTAADLRHKFRIVKDANVWVRVPYDPDRLTLFLGAAKTLWSRHILIDWSDWLKDC